MHETTPLQAEIHWYKGQLETADALKRILRKRLIDANPSDVKTTEESDSFAKSVLVSSASKSDKMAKTLVENFINHMVSADSRAKEVGNEVKAEHLAAAFAVNAQLQANLTFAKQKTDKQEAALTEMEQQMSKLTMSDVAANETEVPETENIVPNTTDATLLLYI